MAHTAGKAEFVHGGYRIPAPDNSNAALLCRAGHDFGKLFSSFSESVELKHADRPVPDYRLCPVKRFFVKLYRFRSHIQAHQVIRQVDSVYGNRLRSRVKGFRRRMIHRQHYLSAGLVRRGKDFLRRTKLVVFHKGLTRLVALGLEERERHAAAYHQRGGVFQQTFQHGDFGRYLGPADYRDKRFLGTANDRFKVAHLFFHQETGGGGHKPCNTGGGSMIAMRRPESVVHKHIAVGRKFLGQPVPLRPVFRGLFFMKTGIFQHYHRAFRLRLDERLLAETTVLAGKNHRPAQLAGKVISHRLHPAFAPDEGGLVKALARLLSLLTGGLRVLCRVAQVTHQREAFCALLKNIVDGRQRRDNAGIVPHDAVLHRHVKINAHDHALALQVKRFYRLQHSFLLYAINHSIFPPLHKGHQRDGSAVCLRPAGAYLRRLTARAGREHRLRAAGALPGQPKAGLGSFGPAIAGLIRNSRTLLQSFVAAQGRPTAVFSTAKVARLTGRRRRAPPACYRGADVKPAGRRSASSRYSCRRAVPPAIVLPKRSPAFP